MPTVYGYARSSKDEQEASPRRQRQWFIDEWQEKHKDKGPLCVVKEWDSATSIAYNDRPIFMRLLAELKRGDTLMVWRFDRIDRNARRMINAVHEVAKRGVSLFVLDEPSLRGTAFDPDDMNHRLMVYFRMIQTDMEGEQRSKTLKKVLGTLKENGQVYCRAVAYGKKRLYTMGANGKVHKEDVWCIEECVQLCELYLRRQAGDGWRMIARDWHDRGLMRVSTDALWAPRNSKSKPGYASTSTITRAADMVFPEIEQQAGLGGVTLAQVFLAALRGGADWAVKLEQRGHRYS